MFYPILVGMVLVNVLNVPDFNVVICNW